MLKAVIIITIAMISTHSIYAQQQSPINNQYLKFQRIIIFEGKTKEELMKGLKKVLYNLYDSAEVISSAGNRFLVESEFDVIGGLIGRLGHPEGKLDFKMAVEVKDNKFRYSLYDFHFTPVKRNRYGRYDLLKKKTLAVNEENYAGRQDLLNKIKDQSRAYAGRLDDRLKELLSISYTNNNKW